VWYGPSVKTCEYDGTPFTDPRSHPWTDVAGHAGHRYYDFRAEPARIRTSLEDFVPWARYPAIDAVYTLLEWVNGATSTLESNDCAFTGPHANETATFAKNRQCSGRIMVLHRVLAENLSRARVKKLKNVLHQRLGAIDCDFEWGVIGTTIIPVRYVSLPEGAQLGTQLMISFWAWGNTDAELMTNLGRVVRNLFHGLRPEL